jgi:hypothetical protein
LSGAGKLHIAASTNRRKISLEVVAHGGLIRSA